MRAKVVGVAVVCVLAVAPFTIPRGEAVDQRQRELGEACVSAGQRHLDPLVTYPSGEIRAVQVDGTDWRVTTALDHKTKWADHWYDVTCVVGWTSPDLTVKTVAATER